ncbi:MAG: hypothetical protein DMG34_14725 [Acidobacteria bacterium]|nr:MAG: hypothetical protein DMG34_14725 [Acidobacteriota bacterium]
MSPAFCFARYNFTTVALILGARLEPYEIVSPLGAGLLNLDLGVGREASLAVDAGLAGRSDKPLVWRS